MIGRGLACLLALAAAGCLGPWRTAAPGPARASLSSGPGSGLAARVFVVERDRERLAVYDYFERRLLPQRIEGLGNMRHATMVFSPDLRYGYVATRNGLLSRIDLATLERAGDVQVSASSIDIAISQDGRWVATAEYQPGGVTILDAHSLAVVGRIPGRTTRDGAVIASRVTGIVDVPGNRFACVLIEGAEIWIIDASRPGFPVVDRFRTSTDMPYDAMITPDGRYYVVGHLGSEHVTVVDLRAADPAPREISLRDPERRYERGAPVKLPHMASWAVAADRVFVPLVGEERLAVLETGSWRFLGSIPLRGHPVYAVAAPDQAEVWVSFSGAEDDAHVQVIDAATLAVKKTIELGRRIYHLDFTPRGAYVLVSANEDNRLFLVDATRYEIVDRQPVESPSGVFGVWRAFRIGL